MSLKGHKNGGCSFKYSIGALSLKIPWCLQESPLPLQEVPKNGFFFFQFQAPPSFKQVALIYGVILALDFTSNR